MTISAKSYNELKSTAGKIALFEEIQMRVNEILKQYMGIEPVVEVLQTKFLIQ
jgi:flagellar basal body-associated protein FliL